MKTILNLALLGSLGCLYAQEEAELSLSGKSYFETGTNSEFGDRTFENWTDVHGEYGSFSSDLGITAFMPARSYSADTTSPGLGFANLGWSSESQEIKVGHFYHQLGNGVTLRSYRDYLVRWNNNLLGFLWKGSGQYWKANAFGAKPRDNFGARHAPIHGGEIDLLPIRGLEIGATAAASQTPDSTDMKWGSALGKYSAYGETFGMGIKGEYALRARNDKAQAIYGAIDLMAGPLSIVTEYKDYLSYDINNGAILNNAPVAAKEHTFSFMARKQLQISANDVVGWTSEATYKLPFQTQEWNLRATTTTATDHDDFEYYREYFGQLEINKDALGIVLGGGWQRDAEELHYNGVYSGNYPITDNFFFKTIFEHQWAQVRMTHEEYYAQIYRATLSLFRKLSIGVVTERLVQAHKADQVWPGLQIDWHATDKASLTSFVGMRRAGKDCSGGVCVTKPEFTGLELVGNLSF